MNAFLAVSNPDSSAAIPNQILPLSCTPKKREEQLSEESRPWPLELIFWKWKAYGCVNNLTLAVGGAGPTPQHMQTGCAEAEA